MANGSSGGGVGPGVEDAAWIFHETAMLHLAAAGVGGGEEAPVSPDIVLDVRVYARNNEIARHARTADDLVGVGNLPLRGLVASGATGATSRRASDCTFNRPVEISIMSLEGLPVGRLEVNVCGLAEIQRRAPGSEL